MRQRTTRATWSRCLAGTGLYAALSMVCLALASGTVRGQGLDEIEVTGVTRDTLRVTCAVLPCRPLIRIQSRASTDHTVSLAVSELVGPDYDRVSVTWTLGTSEATSAVRLPAGGSTMLELMIRGMRLGSYAGTIVLSVEGRQRFTTLLVSHARTPLVVEVHGLGAVRATGRMDAMWLALADTSGQEQRVELPEIVRLTRVEDSSEPIQAQFDRLRIMDEDSQTVAGAIIIPPNRSRRLKLTLEGLDEAGQYQATIRVGALGQIPRDSVVTIYLRDRVFWAGTWMSLGVVISLLLRRYGTRTRPRLEQEIRVAQLQVAVDEYEDAAGDLRSDERDDLAYLRGRVRREAENIRLGLSDSTEETLATLGAQLELFADLVSVRRLIDALEPRALQPPLRAELTTIRRAFRDQSLTPDKAKQVTTRLRGLEGKIEDVARQQIVREIDALRQEATEWMAVNGAVDDRANKELLAILESARESANSGDSTSARLALERARGSWASVLAAQFRHELTKADAPVLVPKDRWKRLCEVTRAQLEGVDAAVSGEQAIGAYRSAAQQYYRALADAMQEELDTWRGRILAAGVLQGDAVADKRAELERLGRTLAEHFAQFSRAASAGDLPHARTSLDAVNAAYTAMREKAGEHGVPLDHLAAGQVSAGRAATPREVSESAGVPPPPTRLSVPASVRSRAERDELVARRNKLELVATGVVAGIAVVLGVNLFWVTNHVWGSLGDYLAVFLWGLGLHQVTFAGVAALQDSLFNTK